MGVVAVDIRRFVNIIIGMPDLISAPEVSKGIGCIYPGEAGIHDGNQHAFTPVTVGMHGIGTQHSDLGGRAAIVHRRNGRIKFGTEAGILPKGSVSPDVCISLNPLHTG
ncbi:hypothetical protein D9M69_650010 [compost metagenome]